MPDRIEVLIVGAGPAGLAAGLRLAAAKVNVGIVDTRKKIGYPLRCGEVTSVKYFKVMGVRPRPGWIRHRLRLAPKLFVINRELSELGMAYLAVTRGAHVASGTTVTAVGEFDGSGRLVTLTSEMGTRQIHAGCIMAADGVSSLVARLAGIDTFLSPNRIMSGLAYYVVDAKLRKIQDNHMEKLPFPFPEYPHYFWVIPNGKRRANAGLILPGLDGYKARPLLDRMISETKALTGGRVAQTVVGLIPDARPLKKSYADGILVLGGAARLVDPITAGGILQAALSGKEAAKTFLNMGGAPATESLLIDYQERIEPICSFLEKRWIRRSRREERIEKGLPMRNVMDQPWAEDMAQEESTIMEGI
ncbi:MAG: NAD(P)-binding protein [Proteobacteria bacterium]|nr:NAD(P)-binding protein [Pseudomonadota bacterium]